MEEMVVKKASKMAYRVYDYLKSNHVGKENKTTCKQLQSVFQIKDRREVRKIITEINTYMEFDKTVCRTGGIYIVRVPMELEIAKKTAKSKAMSYLREYSCLTKKGNLDGQCKMSFGKFYKEFRECFEDSAR